jgi:hypothetical protein
LKLLKPAGSECCCDEILGHMAAPKTKQGYQIGVRGIDFGQDRFAGTGSDIGCPELGAAVAKRFKSLLMSQLLQSGLQGEH